MRNLGVKNVGKDGDGKEDCQKGGGGEGSGPPKDGGKKG